MSSFDLKIVTNYSWIQKLSLIELVHKFPLSTIANQPAFFNLSIPYLKPKRQKIWHHSKTKFFWKKKLISKFSNIGQSLKSILLPLTYSLQSVNSVLHYIFLTVFPDTYIWGNISQYIIFVLECASTFKVSAANDKYFWKYLFIIR